jgi:hypothetical protein
MEDAGKWRSELVTWIDKVAPPFLNALGELIGRGVAWLLIEGIPTLVGALITGIVGLVGLSQPDIGKAGEGLAEGIVTGFSEYEGWSKIETTIDQLKFIIIYGLYRIITDAQRSMDELEFIITYGLIRARDAAVAILVGIGAVFQAAWIEATSNLNWFIFDLTTPLQTAIINAVNFLRGVGFMFWSVGTDIMQGIADGIRNSSFFVFSAIWDSVWSAIEWIKRLFGISSPSKLMADLIGLPMSQGIAQGIMSGQGAVMQAAQATVAPAMSPSQYTSIGGNTTNSNSQSWNLNVNSNQNSQGIVSDFSIMQAMA